MSKKEKSDNEYIIEDLEYKIKGLEESLIQKEDFIRILKDVIKANGLEDEVEGVSLVTDEERICIKGIEFLAKLFDVGGFTKDDAQTYDILHKNLRMIRGLSTEDRKKKLQTPKSASELLKIVKNGK